jgi:hypothetical protein
MYILFFSLEYVNMPSLPVSGIYLYPYSQECVYTPFLLESVAISPLSGICSYAFSSRNLRIFHISNESVDIPPFPGICGYRISRHCHEFWDIFPLFLKCAYPFLSREYIVGIRPI